MRVPWGNGRFERVLVYGLGMSGRAATAMLLSRGVSVVAVDAKPGIDVSDLEAAATEKARFELLSGGEPQELPAPAGSIDAVIVSPGVPMDRPLLEDARRRGVPVIAEVELAAPFLNGPIVGITGSNGKSTTTALTGAMLRAAGHKVEVCGNIGEPLVGKIEGQPGRVFVVELSSFQIDGIVTLKPRAAALLNLSEDHLDRYGSMAAYAASKKRLFMNQDANGIAVLNADDPEASNVETQARKRYFSRKIRVEDGCYSHEGRVVEVTPGEPDVDLFRASDVPLAGVHNLENAMAAALLARAIGAEPAELRAGLAGFKGLPHRMERVGEQGGVIWYDDSKGTNPGATAKSLEGFEAGTVHLILGGRNKGADLASLIPLLRDKVRRAYLIGEAADEFEPVLRGVVDFERSGTMDRAVASAAASAKAGESVVLSPACASFDQFRNFVHRGQVFQDLVRKQLEGGPHGEEAGL
ncbi:MAG TPA: UDP-N-acetylmuramoyl-L-alanine--D-glutamate ligase [Thermoanaerobaculia bacterium]|jgi:UDP-N-acetylmuramoylalanine--D-glutamate ligase|nr:UDP-N-acetylmuramoyl-L-alanine--D-glutamate ligase [Thermoanaerobaculia bacterium]